jgi:hypothetical protein
MVQKTIVVYKLLEKLEELEKEHLYRVIGKHETYDPYNQGWSDAIDRVIDIIEND